MLSSLGNSINPEKINPNNQPDGRQRNGVRAIYRFSTVLPIQSLTVVKIGDLDFVMLLDEVR